MQHLMSSLIHPPIASEIFYVPQKNIQLINATDEQFHREFRNSTNQRNETWADKIPEIAYFHRTKFA